MKIVVFIVLLIIFLTCGNSTMSQFRGHYVHRSHTQADKVTYANMLKTLREQTHALITHLRTTHPDDPRTDKLNRWLRESKPLHELEHRESHKAFGYNIDKGKYIAVCLHDKNNVPNTLNETFFVLLHELAHIATKDFAHDDFFWNTFRWLIRTASDAGLYNNVNYNKYPVKYCNHKLNQNPTFFSV